MILRNPFFAEVARGAEDAAFHAGGDLVLCNSDQNAEKQMHYVDWLLARRVDGIVMNSVTPLTPAQQDRLWASAVPIVLLNVSSADQRSPAWRFSSVVADNLAGGEIAGNYLIDLGHTSVVSINGPLVHGTFADRANGFLKAFGDRGLPKPQVTYGEHTVARAYESAKKWLKPDRRITAIFAGNDVIAFGCIRAMMELGIRIPEDISIIGFDNVDMSQITNPPLTTIDQPKYETGKAAVEMLLSMMAKDGIREREHRIIGVRLIERQSCRSISGPVVTDRKAAKHLTQRSSSHSGSTENVNATEGPRKRSGNGRGRVQP